MLRSRLSRRDSEFKLQYIFSPTGLAENLADDILEKHPERQDLALANLRSLASNPMVTLLAATSDLPTVVLGRNLAETRSRLCIGFSRGERGPNPKPVQAGLSIQHADIIKTITAEYDRLSPNSHTWNLNSEAQIEHFWKDVMIPAIGAARTEP